MDQLVKFFTSLRLTVACLVLALGLVFIGTLAQVKWGLYIVQANYFQSLFVYWKPPGVDLRIPVWPGGYLLGSVLLINLIAAHIKRFELSKKKIGIFVVHAGLILLLLGQLFTELFQVESAMRIPEGESRNYSESPRFSELAVIDVTDPKFDQVVSIPSRVLGKTPEIAVADLPFKLRVKEYFQNSDFRLAETKADLSFVKNDPAVKMNDRDIPFAKVEVVTDEGVKGPFPVSNWLSELGLIGIIHTNIGSSLKSDFYKPPTFEYKGRKYEISMRPVRYYKPFSMELLDFTHEVYPGTEIPKNFSSRVKIHKESGEEREALIYMNNPLRYAGETFYQGSFEPGDKVTILQVVQNPSRLTPYIACAMVGAGLLIQFLSHLYGFAKKRMAT